MKVTAKRVFVFSMVLVTVLFCAVGIRAKEPKLKAEDVVERHLESIGPAHIRSALKSCKVEGRSTLEILIGGSGVLQGPAIFLSEGKKLRFSIVFGSPKYSGEELAFDGKKVDIGYIDPGVRSSLGGFFYQFGRIIKEGLFGSVFSTAWPLLDLESRKPKLKYDGLKKVDDKEFHTLLYEGQKSTGVKTRLYFGIESFRHYYTIHRVLVNYGVRQQQETEYILKETFASFVKMEELIVPSQWVLELTIEEGTVGSVVRWATDFNMIYFNQEIEPGQFRLE